MHTKALFIEALHKAVIAAVAAVVAVAAMAAAAGGVIYYSLCELTNC